MRIFTLGKNGIPLFFFALFLLTGISSYGQCPTMTDPTPNDFCYLSTITDLTNATGATVAGGGLAWYRSSSNTESPTPIPSNELLQSGVYFAGNTNGSCTTRIEVSVTVVNAGPPTSLFGVTFQPCEYSEDDTTTVGELIALLQGTEVQIFDDEYSEDALDPNTILVDGENYFAGQRSSAECSTSSRLALRYDPIIALAPTGESVQTFCPGATVADLTAQATNTNTQAFRWYSTATSNPALLPSTPLVDGETYFASQIVNRNNSALPPCESQDRFKVTVEVAPVPFSGNFPLEFCVTEAKNLIDSPEEAFVYFSSLLQGEEVVLDPANFGPGTQAEILNLLAFIDTPVSESETFNFIYNNPSENPECEDGVITIEVKINNVEEADAGTFANQTVCSSDGMIDLTTFIADSGATAGGTFSGEGVEDNMFDASLGAKNGGYTITYSISESEDACITGEASSQFKITVQNAPVSGNIPLNFCIAQAQELVQVPADAEAYLTNILEDMGVNVNPVNFADGDDVELGRLFDYIQNPDSDSETFNFTYTTPATNVCDEGVISIEVTINNGEEADAGTFANQTVCSSDGMIDLTTFIADSGATAGGAFSGEGVEDNMFDASLGAKNGGYNITYTVSGSEDVCITGEASSQFKITVQNAPVSGNIPLNFCIAQAQELVQVPADAEAYLTNILEDMGVNVNPVNFADGDDVELGRLFDYIQNPDSDSETFNFTYTTPATSVCDEGVISIEVTINNGEEADAGTFANQTVCSSDGMIDLTTFIADSGATAGGTFSGEGVEDNMFDASLGAKNGGYTITYTVSGSEDVCITGEASSQFKITVQNAPVSGNIPLNFCIAQAQELVQVPADAEAYLTNILEDMGVNVNPVNFADGDDVELGRLFDYIQNPDSDSETFNFTYTTPATSVCDEGVISIEVTINNGEEADAGTFANQTVCSSDGMIDLTTFIADSGATAGGTFSGEGVEDNIFDASLGAKNGGYTITYSISESEDACITGEASSQFKITVQNAPVSGNIPLNFCIAQAQELVQVPADAEAYLTNILEDMGVNVNPVNFADGDDVELGRLFDYIQNPDSDSETFNFTYTTPATSVCDEGVISIEVTINNGEEADAGTFANQTVCSSDGMIDLTTFIADSGATAGGTFSGEGVEDNMFDASLGTKNGGYTITYTVSGSEDVCITGEASSQFKITVLNGVDAGNDNIGGEVCRNILPLQATESEVRNYLLGLLSPGASLDGTFPNLTEITTGFNTLSSYPTTFSTEYIVGEGTVCESKVTLSQTILRSPNAGNPGQINIDADETDTSSLFNALGGTPDAEGIWTFDGDEVDATFDPATDDEGVYTYTVTSDNGCTDSATVTVIIGDENPGCTTPPAAPTVADFSDCVVTGATVADLDITVDEGNSFTVYTDEALQTPAVDTDVLVEGTYYVTQTTTAGCESEAAMITVTLSDTNAPTLNQDGNVFCEFDNATVADLEANITANGDVTWYTTEDGTETFSSSDVLVDGTTYYAAVTNATSACESSQRLAVTVTLDTCPIVIPEAFSPNGDGINDRFVIENIAAEYPGFKLEIYNRWGDPVYKGGASTPTWDGTSTEGSFGSGVLPAGVYFYILYYNDGQTAPTQGRLYLSR